MKQLTLIALFVVLVVGMLPAQGIVGVGPKLGLNFATAGGDNSSYFSTTTKFFFGGFLDYNVVQNFDLQGELLYNTTGAKFPIGGSTYDVGISYLEIVALADYNVPLEHGAKIFFLAGPQLGFKLSANAHNETTGGDADVSSKYAGADFDIVFGVGASFKAGPGSIVVDVRYCFGLANVNTSNPPSNTNQVISLGVGYAFRVM